MLHFAPVNGVFLYIFLTFYVFETIAKSNPDMDLFFALVPVFWL